MKTKERKRRKPKSATSSPRRIPAGVSDASAIRVAVESSARQGNRAGCNPAERGVGPAFWRQGLDGTFSADAWSCFAKEYWERQPLLLPQVLTQPLASEAEIFQASVEAGAHFRAIDEDFGLSLYVEHARQVASIDDYLPQASDGSLARYAERVSRCLEGRRFGLVLEDIQAYAPTLWWQCRAFLSGFDAGCARCGSESESDCFHRQLRDDAFRFAPGDVGEFQVRRLREKADAALAGSVFSRSRRGRSYRAYRAVPFRRHDLGRRSGRRHLLAFRSMARRRSDRRALRERESGDLRADLASTRRRWK